MNRFEKMIDLYARTPRSLATESGALHAPATRSIRFIPFTITHLLSKVRIPRRLSSLAFVACAAIGLTGASVRAADLPDTLPYGEAGVPESPIVRINATQPRTVDLLGVDVKDPHLPRRVQVVTELGATKLPAAAKYLRQAMTDADPQVRAAAARSARHVGDPTLAADLKTLLHDADARVRVEAVLSGAALGDGSFIDAGLADADPSVIAAAVSVAGPTQAAKVVAICNGSTVAKSATGNGQSSPSPSGGAASPAVPSNGPSPTDSSAASPGGAGTSYAAGAPAIDSPALHVAAVRALGRIGDPQYAGPVANALTGPVPLRAAAAASLGQMKAATHAAGVVKLLNDPHPTVRREALLALPALVAPADLQAKCITALADEDNSVRESAARLLQKSPTVDALPALLADLPIDSARLHAAVRDALVAIGPPVIAPAEKLLADTNPRRREDGSFLLGGLKSDASLDAHMALMKDADWQVVRQAAVSLGQIGRKDAAPAVAAVANLAQNPPLDIAANDAIEQSIAACGVLGDASILPMCKTILPNRNKYNGNFRAAAAFAIGRAGDRSDSSLGKLLTHPLADVEEAENVKFECVKAMGQLKLQAAAGVAGKDRATAKFAGDARTDYLVYWVRSRVLPPQPPLTPFPINWEADTSVRPLRD